MQIPLSIILANSIRKVALGEVIQDIKINCFNEGEYCLDTLSFERIKELIGQKIVKVNTDSLYAENGMVVEFRVDNGGVRVFEREKEPPTLKKKPKTGGFSVTFVFERMCMMIIVNSWTCIFKVHTNSNQIEKYPIDVTSPTDFTLERFNEWLNSRGNIAIIDACATSKGAFDVAIPFMNYILWMCKIHPKSKIKKLDQDEKNYIQYNRKYD